MVRPCLLGGVDASEAWFRQGAMFVTIEDETGVAVHLIANQLTDLYADFAGVDERDNGFPVLHGRGDQIRKGGSF
jgi:hypothetical protein